VNKTYGGFFCRLWHLPRGGAPRRFAQVKEEPVQRAGDTEQSAWASRLLAALALVFGVVGGSHALQIVDDRGVTVTLPASPQRIVSLLPSLAETVCALDRCQRLVGVDRYSVYPESLRKLPQVGGGLEPKTHADVQRVILKVGQLLEVPDAQRIWRAIDAGVSAAAQSLPAHVRGVRVYFEVNQGPYAASEASFIGETLTRLGARNVVPGALGPFPKLNPEFVVRANPDLIMIGQRSVDALQTRPGWQSIRALREKRVCDFPADQADVLVRPGPRMAEAARLMARCLESKAPGAKP
jgi:iron complex transport system substrate-binding protein